MHCKLWPLLLLISCSSKASLFFPSESPFPDELWYGVVTSTYLRIYTEVGTTSELVTTLRKGDLVKIYQIRDLYDRAKKNWRSYYFIEDSSDSYGWADSELINLYDYEVTAKQAKTILELQN